MMFHYREWSQRFQSLAGHSLTVDSLSAHQEEQPLVKDLSEGFLEAWL